jgi:CRISPR-associated protein Cas2
MPRKNWHLLAYDIRDPRRLQRVHRFLTDHGLAAQESVFVVRASRDELSAILDGLGAIIDRRRDDVRTYPVAHPGALWLSGPNPLAGLKDGRQGRRKAGRKARPATGGLLGRLLKGGRRHG